MYSTGDIGAVQSVRGGLDSVSMARRAMRGV